MLLRAQLPLFSCCFNERSARLFMSDNLKTTQHNNLTAVIGEAVESGHVWRLSLLRNEGYAIVLERKSQ